MVLNFVFFSSSKDISDISLVFSGTQVLENLEVLLFAMQQAPCVQPPE